MGTGERRRREDFFEGYLDAVRDAENLIKEGANPLSAIRDWIRTYRGQ